MKNYRKLLMIGAIASTLCACGDFLDENPMDFNSPENSYITSKDFDMSITDLYYLTRYEFFQDQDRAIDYLYGTDLLDRGDQTKSNLEAELTPSSDISSKHWKNWYKVIASANMTISKIDGSELNDDEKVEYEAKAKFFRAFAYRTLVYLYGGVPYLDKPVTSYVADKARESREFVLEKALEDAEFAAENLRDITDANVKDGEINKQAAQLLASELNLALDNYDEAINYATEVINCEGLSLMTERFGRRKSEPGDVYWDLFQRKNQNRGAGNTEAIWVAQLANVDAPGGGSRSNIQFWDNPSNYLLERHCSPQVNKFKIVTSENQQLTPFRWPVDDCTGGRGIGSGYANYHFHNEIWVSGDAEELFAEGSQAFREDPEWKNDIRNSNYNFIRVFQFNNKDFMQSHPEFGTEIDVMDPKANFDMTDDEKDEVSFITGDFGETKLPCRGLTGYQAKVTTPGDHPDALILNKETHDLAGTAGGTFCDQYLYRLTEAYFLRAEAYAKKGDYSKAKDDINVIRNRSNAPAVSEDDFKVDNTGIGAGLDYILDERMREYGVEEKRRLTLGRMGTEVFFKRVKKYGTWYSSEHSATGEDFKEKFTLYPIPLRDIEANTVELTQNPGY
ncbi:MAG: RagB/SusD family nutrient uptake outer membrane protein [Bacteroidaceae bacterium]|nr:RagB/SusD family nutrient uptake outer membrane protein [Bacteroidaceae bacterium]